MKKFVIAILFLSAQGSFSEAAPMMSKGKWKRKASKIVKILNFKQKTDRCGQQELEDFSGKFMISRDTEGKICKIYDLSFPTLSSLFSKVPSSELRIKKPKFLDYKHFLGKKVSEQGARNFLSENLNKKDLKKSWYSKIKFKNSSLRNLRTNEDGVFESFRVSDMANFNQKLKFKSKERNLLLSLLLGYGAEKEKALNFVDSPRSFLENINFEYDSIKKAYKVFLDFEFLPIKGPVALVDHDVQYRGWLQAQIRSLVLFGINRLMFAVSPTLEGRIISVVINDAFSFIDMTYEFQRKQLEQTLRMALDGSVRSSLSKKELEDSLYLLHVQDSSAVASILTTLIQTGSASIDNLYPYGKSTALRSFQLRESMSDKSFSKMHFEKKCDVKALTYYFAHCESQGEVYSLISETSIFLWNFGNPKIMNLDSPWEVILKRGMAYLLSSAVEINFFYFPEWINSQVSGALRSYAFSGVMDEAYVLSELYERQRAGESLSSFEEDSYQEIMSKNIIPFLPKSQKGLNKTIAVHRKILMDRK